MSDVLATKRRYATCRCGAFVAFSSKDVRSYVGSLYVDCPECRMMISTWRWHWPWVANAKMWMLDILHEPED